MSENKTALGGFYKIPLVVIGQSARTNNIYTEDVLVPALNKFFSQKQPLYGEVNSPRPELLSEEVFEKRLLIVDNSRVSHFLLNEYEIEDGVVYGRVGSTGPMSNVFETMRAKGVLAGAMRCMLQVGSDNVVTKMEIITFDLSSESLTDSTLKNLADPKVFVERKTRSVYAFRYMGYLGAVPEFMRTQLSDHYASLPELDYHQEKIEFYRDANDVLPNLVCNTGDWIVRRDRVTHYDTVIMTDEAFKKTYVELVS